MGRLKLRNRTQKCSPQAIIGSNFHWYRFVCAGASISVARDSVNIPWYVFVLVNLLFWYPGKESVHPRLEPE